MIRILITVPVIRPCTAPGFSLLRHIALLARNRADRRHLAKLSCDRLRDMGIAPRSDANLRSSGAAGPVPRADLW